MGYMLTPGLSFALVGGRTVFLDLRKDRYFCLPATFEPAFLRLVDADIPTDADTPALDALVCDGILEPVSGQGTITPFAPAFSPATSLLDGPRISVGAWRQARAAWALKRSQHELKSRRLSDLVTAVSGGRPEHEGSSHISEDAYRICWAFETAGLLVTPLRNCLSRSLALARNLRERGHACDLLIGVAVNPFQAHAWVQAGDTVLNDRLERVLQFVPVMAA